MLCNLVQLELPDGGMPLQQGVQIRNHARLTLYAIQCNL